MAFLILVLFRSYLSRASLRRARRIESVSSVRVIEGAKVGLVGVDFKCEGVLCLLLLVIILSISTCLLPVVSSSRLERILISAFLVSLWSEAAD